MSHEDHTVRKDTIHAGMSVNEVIRLYPATVSVFNDFGVDACCGGAASLSEAAVDAYANFNAMMSALNEVSLPSVEASAS